MEYKDLADIIYPDAKPIEYYEEKYGARNLPEGAAVTRFAPSPTGFTHIGGLYGAIVDKTIAKQTNGVFILRIEDTDQKREVENGTSLMIKELRDFNIIPDEGMVGENEEIGNYGPYKQSSRKEIYSSFAKWLIERGMAYPCFATAEELEEMREKQQAAKLRPGYYGVWAKYRNLPVDEAIEKIKNGETFVIRLRSQGVEDRKIKFKDTIKGNIEFPENDQDSVLIKANGIPVYHFAHVVDDHLMRITHIIRGEEWLSSTPLHIELFNCFKFKMPKIAHTANMLKNDGEGKRKISKRKDPEAAVSYYAEEGIPSDAVYEYLLNIANSSFEGWRRGNKGKDISEFKFEINKMSISGAIFDIVKLLDVSKNVISTYDAKKVYDESYKWASQYDKELKEILDDKEYALKVFGVERDNSNKPRKDLAKWSDVKENIAYMYEDRLDKDYKNYAYGNISDKEKIKEILKEYIELYNENHDKQAWFDTIKELAGKLGYAREVKEYKENPDAYPGHVGDVSTVIRVSITGRQNTPDLHEIMQVLGKEIVIKRLNNVIENI